MPNDMKQESTVQKKKVHLGKNRDQQMKMEQACDGFYPVAAASYYDDLEDKL
jgi:hypothetical protein